VSSNIGNDFAEHEPHASGTSGRRTERLAEADTRDDAGIKGGRSAGRDAGGAGHARRALLRCIDRHALSAPARTRRGAGAPERNSRTCPFAIVDACPLTNLRTSRRTNAPVDPERPIAYIECLLDAPHDGVYRCREILTVWFADHTSRERNYLDSGVRIDVTPDDEIIGFEVFDIRDEDSVQIARDTLETTTSRWRAMNRRITSR
jgi:hypothetical protein